MTPKLQVASHVSLLLIIHDKKKNKLPIFIAERFIFAHLINVTLEDS